MITVLHKSDYVICARPLSECVHSTHVQDSFYCSSSALSGQQIIIIIIIMLEMVRMLIDKYD